MLRPPRPWWRRFALVLLPTSVARVSLRIHRIEFDIVQTSSSQPESSADLDHDHDVELLPKRTVSVLPSDPQTDVAEPAESSPASGLRVLVVDDHNTFAELLTDALDREPDLVSVGHATTGRGGVAMFADLRPDVVLMDLQLPDIDGFVATAQIVAMSPDARVIILTAHVTAAVVASAATSGACGFLPKDGHLAGMLSTIRTARPGSLAVDPALMARLTEQPKLATRALARPLSQRELSVLLRMADGRDVTRIAQELCISQHTSRGHVKSVLSKLGAHSQLEAVIIAVRIGLIQINAEPVTPGAL